MCNYPVSYFPSTGRYFKLLIISILEICINKNATIIHLSLLCAYYYQLSGYYYFSHHRITISNEHQSYSRLETLHSLLHDV